MIHYHNQTWEYEGCEWPELGILALNLKSVGSNSTTVCVREAYIQHDNPDELRRLWKATPQPVYASDPTLHEMFAVLQHKEFKTGKGDCYGYNGRVSAKRTRVGKQWHMSSKSPRKY